MSGDDIIQPIDRDQQGRFQPGNRASGGRPKGARNKLTELFLEDLHTIWQTHGKQALIDCAKTEPAAFCRTMASLIRFTVVKIKE